MNWQDFITVTPGVRSGKPCITGTRITVSDILGYLASGMSEAEILSDFPELKPEHIHAVLAFAAERERRLAAIEEAGRAVDAMLAEKGLTEEEIVADFNRLRKASKHRG